MQTALAYIIAIIGFVIALNFVMLYFRLKRDRYRKPSKEAIEEAKAVVWRDKEIRRRIDREQEEAAHEVELRNKTLALYEEVRRRAAARETEAAEKQPQGAGEMASSNGGLEICARATDFASPGEGAMTADAASQEADAGTSDFIGAEVGAGTSGFIDAEVGVRTTDFISPKVGARERDTERQGASENGPDDGQPGLWTSDWGHGS